MANIAQVEDILKFWFVESDPSKHFNGGPSFDEEIRSRFKDTLDAAKACELWTWRSSIHGRLAEIIVLDQFSRNVYRQDPRSFSSDTLALALSQELIKDQEGYEQLTDTEKQFALMPLMHSESLKVHEELAIPYFKKLDRPDPYRYELAHYEQIKQFGRYPFRNEVLKRTSTPEEMDFMSKNKPF